MKRWLEQNWRWLPLFTLAGLLDFNLIHQLISNRFYFTYALDDAYISLHMAEQIASGHYGMNVGEYASAASSILWPFLLAPFKWIGLLQFAPLILNIMFGFCAVVSLVQGISFIFRHAEKNLWPQLALMSCLLVPALNLPGLVLLGMEHSLQLWLVLLIALVLVRLLDAGVPPPRWIYAVLVLLPLVRYEGLAISGVAVLVLAQRGYAKKAIAAGLTALLLVAAFGYWLTTLGLAPIPHSALNKLVVGGSWWLRALGALPQVESWLMLAGLYAFLLAAARAHNLPRRLNVLLLSLPLVAQLCIGRLGNGHRFEIAAIAFSVLMLLFLHREALAALLQREVRTRSLIRIGVAITCVFFVYVVNSLWFVASAANDIYLQHRQMAVFVRDYYQKPVAVNDIGYVSFKNPNMVVDLVGISSSASRAAVMSAAASGDAAPIRNLLLKEKVKLMMVYAPWFKAYVPKGWKVVANLSLAHTPVAAQGGTVTFYAAPDEVAAARKALTRFAPAVPKGVYLDMVAE